MLHAQGAGAHLDVAAIGAVPLKGQHTAAHLDQIRGLSSCWIVRHAARDRQGAGTGRVVEEVIHANADTRSAWTTTQEDVPADDVVASQT